MRILLAFPLLLLTLSGCIISATMQKYPRGWAPLEIAGPEGRCPQLAGVYAEWGEAPNGCHSGEEACRSLSYNLLGDNIGYKEFWDKNATPRFPIGTHVELRQPADDRLEIIRWRIEDGKEQVVGRKTLKSEKGDFTCGVDGLKLRTRAVYLFLGVSNLLGDIGRDFNVSNDGSLVMRSRLSYIGHHTIIPGAHSFGIWIRWPASGRDAVTSGN